jgi:lipopolysaccharide export LptBFGC system permease protein LptF
MNNRLTITDILMLLSAFLSLIFSEVLWFQGEKEAAIFVGLWVPSILGFAIYLKLLKKQNND